MNKILLSIFFVLFAFMGIACVSACDADNCAVEHSGAEAPVLNLAPPFGIEPVDDGDQRKVVVKEDTKDPKDSHAYYTIEKVSKKDINNSKVCVDGVNDSIVPIKNVVLAKNVKENKNSFLPDYSNKALFAIVFDPETGIMKVNPDCPYMHSKYVNATGMINWGILVSNTCFVDNICYSNEYEIGPAHPMSFTDECNLTSVLKCFRMYPYECGGHYICKLNVDVPDVKDFSIDFVFDLYVDEFNNFKFGNLEKSVAHVSGKDIIVHEVKNNHWAALLGIYVPLDVHVADVTNKILNAEKKAYGH